MKDAWGGDGCWLCDPHARRLKYLADRDAASLEAAMAEADEPRGEYLYETTKEGGDRV